MPQHEFDFKAHILTWQPVCFRKQAHKRHVDLVYVFGKLRVDFMREKKATFSQLLRCRAK